MTEPLLIFLVVGKLLNFIKRGFFAPNYYNLTFDVNGYFYDTTARTITILKIFACIRRLKYNYVI